MKLVIYSISQKQPPIGEPVIRYEVEDGQIQRFWFAQLEVAKATDPEEIALCMEDGVSHLVVWSSNKGMNDMSEDVRQDDYWSYVAVSRGE